MHEANPKADTLRYELFSMRRTSQDAEEAPRGRELAFAA